VCRVLNELQSELGHHPNLDKRVLFFARVGCEASLKGIQHLERLGFDVKVIFSESREQSMEDEILDWEGDYIFCYRSLFILPKLLLERARIAAINFHPGPPEYPGSGCINYALYENSQLYGVTAHLMSEKIDSGCILECRRFSIHKSDNVDSLLERTHSNLEILFLDFTKSLAEFGRSYLDNRLEFSRNEKWSGVKRKISELDALATIDKDMSRSEIENVIRATYTKAYPPKIIIHGYEFLLNSDKKI